MLICLNVLHQAGDLISWGGQTIAGLGIQVQGLLFCMLSRNIRFVHVWVSLCILPRGQNKTSKAYRLSFINANQCVWNEVKDMNAAAEIVVEWIAWSFSKWGFWGAFSLSSHSPLFLLSHSCGFLMHFFCCSLCSNIYTVNIMDGVVLPGAWAICMQVSLMTTADPCRWSITMVTGRQGPTCSATIDRCANCN